MGWKDLFLEKQKDVPYHSTFVRLCRSFKGMGGYLERTSNIQHVLSSLLLEKKPKGSKTDKRIMVRQLDEMATEEAAFALLVLCIVRSLDPHLAAMHCKVVNRCLEKLRTDTCLNAESCMSDPAATLMDGDWIFTRDEIARITSSPEFALSLALLNKRLGRSYTAQDALVWVSSLMEPAVPEALKRLVETSTIPLTILCDVLLRRLKNELEYQYAYEIYKSNYAKLNVLDQEKLHQQRQFETHYNRQLVVPPMFSNLFEYALRHRCEDLPKLVGMFVESNSLADEDMLAQLSEIAWKLSADHTGEFVGKPSRHYYVAQSMVVKCINEMVRQNRGLEVDPTIILAVSNLSYYKNPQKAYRLFKSAQQRFDHWKLQTFRPEGFERVDGTSEQDAPVGRVCPQLASERIDDYNLRFLCNSVVLLHVTEENHLRAAKDLREIFQQVEPRILHEYPEVWEFVLAKLSYHRMVRGSIYGFLIDGYCSQVKAGNPHAYALDVLVRDATSFSSIYPVLANVDVANFDENNVAHLISKLYRFGPSLKDDLAHIDVVSLARDLYKKASFKSSRVNASYLLGEAVVTPDQTYVRYESMDFKSSPLAIAALLLAVNKLVQTGQYETTLWGKQTPLEYAYAEYDAHISRAYGDGQVYPNDHLLGVYIDAMIHFKDESRLLGLLNTLVDLKYPVSAALLERFLKGFGSRDGTELVACLNRYMAGTRPVQARGQFKRFVDALDVNWGIVGRWEWPGKNDEKRV